MSYIQQDPDTHEFLPSSSQSSVQGLPSTHASVAATQPDTSSQPPMAVPHITFLYKLVDGIADKSFGEPYI